MQTLCQRCWYMLPWPNFILQLNPLHCFLIKSWTTVVTNLHTKAFPNRFCPCVCVYIFNVFVVATTNSIEHAKSLHCVRLCNIVALMWLDAVYYASAATDSERPLLLLLCLLVHGQVNIIFAVSVCLFVCLCVCLCRVFLSRLWSDFDQTRIHVICLGLVVSPRI